MKRLNAWFGAWILAVGFLGCGPSAGPPGSSEMEERKLREVGEMYRLHQEMVRKPPRSIADFQRVGDASTRTAYSALRTGDVIVRYQATLPDTDVEPSSPESDEVLAYGKSVPESGGPVLMLDRRIRQMTADAFKTARLAGTEEIKKAGSSR